MTLSEHQNDVGLVLGERYQLMREIASGASGTVYEGRDRETKGRVAVKLLHSDLLGSEEHVRRFLREMRAAGKIDHPGVVRFLGAGRGADGRPYLVQEYLDGDDLLQMIEQGSVALPEVFEIGVQLLDALAAVHARGIVHRDVKPENIIVSHDEFGGVRVKLVDFGVVKRKGRSEMGSDPSELTEDSSLTGLGTVVGTPNYMSPEQARGEDIDGRSDLWSVGVVLFQALTEALPFDAESQMLVLANIVGAPAPALRDLEPGLPSWLGAIVDRALQKDPSKRFQSATEMAEALKKGTARHLFFEEEVG